MQATALKAISTPTRRRILELTWRSERTAGEIASQFDISWPAISQNLKVLKQAGLLRERRDGNHRLYRADQAALGPLKEVIKQMWRSDLEVLGRVAAEESRRR